MSELFDNSIEQPSCYSKDNKYSVDTDFITHYMLSVKSLDSSLKPLWGVFNDKCSYPWIWILSQAKVEFKIIGDLFVSLKSLLPVNVQQEIANLREKVLNLKKEAAESSSKVSMWILFL